MTILSYKLLLNCVDLYFSEIKGTGENELEVEIVNNGNTGKGLILYDNDCTSGEGFSY